MVTVMKTTVRLGMTTAAPDANASPAIQSKLLSAVFVTIRVSFSSVLYAFRCNSGMHVVCRERTVVGIRQKHTRRRAVEILELAAFHRPQKGKQPDQSHD